MSKQDRPRGTMAALDRLIESTRALGRATTVFGDPVTSGATTVVPVARISALTLMGGGTGRFVVSNGDGAGGTGLVRARPSGFLVVSPEGAAYRSIRQPVTRLVLPLAAISALTAARIVGVSLREARRRKALESARRESESCCGSPEM
ncbi:GerW family sporulation protein [Nocardiopsis alba]|uniref:GerW family sporulation protein n=1 Tax=Nocardiopsis alba TaxID=53437 RepID=UPI00364B9E2D